MLGCHAIAVLTSPQLLKTYKEAWAERYREALKVRFPQGKGTRVKVGVRNDQGTAVLDFTGIPMDQVHLLFEALKTQLPS